MVVLIYHSKSVFVMAISKSFPEIAILLSRVICYSPWVSYCSKTILGAYLFTKPMLLEQNSFFGKFWHEEYWITTIYRVLTNKYSVFLSSILAIIIFGVACSFTLRAAVSPTCSLLLTMIISLLYEGLFNTIYAGGYWYSHHGILPQLHVLTKSFINLLCDHQHISGNKMQLCRC